MFNLNKFLFFLHGLTTFTVSICATHFQISKNSFIALLKDGENSMFHTLPKLQDKILNF